MMRVSTDDRRLAYCDIFPEIQRGDINVSIIEPGAALFWHRHQFQADYQIVVKGSLKIGVCNMPFGGNHTSEDSLQKFVYQRIFWETKYKKIAKDSLLNRCGDHLLPNNIENLLSDVPTVSWNIFSEWNTCNGPLYIPAGLWHGSYNYTNEPAILIYHITRKWTNGDEERFSYEDMGWSFEREIK